VQPEASSARVWVACGGHLPPIVTRRDAAPAELACRGRLLGVHAELVVRSVEVELGPGDGLVLYTDGVLEARREGELYGFDRLDKIVSDARGLSAQDLAETVLADCRDFANNELADDCAVVVIKRVG
jgi:sigma-B regulation protein RsbU (phosphoserine phosphatase)